MIYLMSDLKFTLSDVTLFLPVNVRALKKYIFRFAPLREPDHEIDALKRSVDFLINPIFDLENNVFSNQQRLRTTFKFPKEG